MGIEPIYAMAGGVMLGGVLQLAVQIPALHRLGLLPRIGLGWSTLRTAWNDPGTRHVARMMLPALLGVGVAQISLLINTQIASWLAPGSVTWLTYADRLMEFPTAMLGVALGVVLMPQLAGARAGNDPERYSAMLDWGLRLVVLLAVPSSIALLVFAQPLVATLFHYGAFKDSDVPQVALALAGYGAGLVGLVAIKVLAPGLLRQPGHAHAGAHRHRGAGDHAAAQHRAGAAAQARRAGPVDRHGRADQRGLAAGRRCSSAAATGRRRAGAGSRCRSSPPARCWRCS